MLRSDTLTALGLAMALTACMPDSKGTAASPESCGLSLDQLGQFVQVPAGSFIKGAAPVYPEESPSLRLQVPAFEIQAHEVTHQQFAAFVEATGYVSDAEQGVIDGRDGAGSAVFTHPADGTERSQPWALVETADWRHPTGAETALEDRNLFPVIHVSKQDAEAYAEWAGGRLPSEIEWEYAANLGLPDPEDPVSGAYGTEGPRANTWQGVFPVADIGTDGHTGIAPVGCFESDQIGLYDMIGNVWEWTDTPFGAGTHTLKGGSYLCANNFCRRYRPAARHPQDTDFSSNHIGFRIVRDVTASDPP
ncbi:MAG: SUMF1/EgtB/PvdO family nonheme iron enzyme [Pseudomonadota bacterium]